MLESWEEQKGWQVELSERDTDGGLRGLGRGRRLRRGLWERLCRGPRGGAASHSHVEATQFRSVSTTEKGSDRLPRCSRRCQEALLGQWQQTPWGGSPQLTPKAQNPHKRDHVISVSREIAPGWSHQGQCAGPQSWGGRAWAGVAHAAGWGLAWGRAAGAHSTLWALAGGGWTTSLRELRAGGRLWWTQ